MRKHQSSRPSAAPCAYCLRNPECPKGQRDFFHEQWVLNLHGDATLDDATSSDVALLKTLHGIIQREYDNLPIIKEVKK